MPEIKNTFAAGKMNKDRDERLVPPGEYRDALNVNVGRSEEAGTGVLENLLGNELVSGGLLGTCIGSIRYDLEEKIYWFVSGDLDGIYEYDQVTGDTKIIIRGNGLNFSPESLITGINIIEGLLLWTDDRNEPRKLNIAKWRDEANHSNDITRIYGREFVEADITVIKPHPKEGLKLTLSSNADSKQPPFEEIFPRFAYRWKYDDGEYSPFSYFTDVAFVPGTYDAVDHYKEGYNESVRNTVNSIRISNIPKGTPDVVSVDLLYNESLSQTIYTLRTIEKVDFGQDPLYIEDQTITKRSFYSAVPNNQLGRPFDNVPRLAKSQEITANRLMYANYLQNFPQPTKADIGVSQVSNTNFSGPSIKGNRDYDVGVVYEDVYGRQGALITGDNSTYKSKFHTNGTERLRVRVDGDAPEWATHFKHYVKDVSMDHHSFTCYNTYNDSEAGVINSEFIWLQIPSDDRNKIDENTFMVPRRHTHGGIINSANQLGFTYTGAQSTSQSHNYNVAGSAALRNYDRYAWFSGGNNTERRADSGLTGGDFNESVDGVFNDGVFTATAEGTYNLYFSGTLTADPVSAFGRGSHRPKERLVLRSGLQIAKAGEPFGGPDTVDKSTYGEMPWIQETHSRDLSFSSILSADLEEGDRVRAVILSIQRRDTGAVNSGLSEVSFGTISTPANPNLTDGGVESDAIPFTEFSRHKVLEVENEAPDIVRNQLPVDLRKLGNTMDYGNSGDKNVYLVQSIDADDNKEDDTGYTSESEVLTYQASDEGEGFRYYPFIGPLNTILDRESLERLVIYIGVEANTIQQSDRTISVDVSGVEGGIFLGIGGANSLPNTGVAGKVRVNEISVGFNGDELTERERANIQFVLAEPVGVDPKGASLSIFKGDITDTAQKRLQGSFFVKTSRATNNPTVPFLPTGQSQFDDDDNVTTLQTIWFETLPVVDDSNLNLYWEASESIPIEQHGQAQTLSFSNCVSMVAEEGTFIETQRIFDRFNSVQINKGVRVNVPQEGYGEERRFAGLIWSGIFNSRTGTNRLNQFIQADGITKEIEPNYGSIQKLHTRDTNLVVFAEDKVFRILADKDALFNADGGGNVSASNAVLGQTTPFAGEYGISLNPESFSTYGTRIYFTDRNRGVILRLANDGLTEISRYGCSDFFRDLLERNTGAIWGSFNDYSDHYNVSFSDYTVSFEDDVNGWVSRKSYIPESGLSLNNRYYTWKGGNLWVHHSRTSPRNNFYGEQYNSTVTSIFNQEPSSIKNYKTVNYEGTPNWKVPMILTDQQAGYVGEFAMKEGKWFSHVSGTDNTDIISEIESVSALGAIDFYDEDGLGNLYTFNNGMDSELPCDVLGIGLMSSVEKVGGGEPTPATEEVTVTFKVEKQ